MRRERSERDAAAPFNSRAFTALFVTLSDRVRGRKKHRLNCCGYSSETSTKRAHNALHVYGRRNSRLTYFARIVYGFPAPQQRAFYEKSRGFFFSRVFSRVATYYHV